jgi:hypothetical protein
MIPATDVSMIGLKARGARAKPKTPAFTAAQQGAAQVQATEPPQDEPWMTYAVARENGVWRIVFHGAKVGCFDSFDAALTAARALARECAALGRTACVMLDPNAPPSKRETYAARGPVFAGFLTPHEA